jgi:WD40 repeat protein/predicted negative regulator of RcsB-dependent stress response
MFHVWGAGDGAVFSPEGSRIVTTADETVRIWDANTFAELGQLKAGTDRVGRIAISPDGARIVVTYQYREAVRVWDANTFTELGQLEGHTGIVSTVAITPDGARIITGSWDKTARVWDAKNFRELAILKGHADLVISVAVSPDGSRIVTGSSDHTARVWDAHSYVGSVVAFEHTGNSVIAANGKIVVSQFADYSTGAFSADYSAEVWKLSPEMGPSTNGREIIAILKGHSGSITSAVVSADETRIITGSRDKTVRVWERRPGAEPSAKEWETVGMLNGHTGEIASVALSPDETRIITGSGDKTMRVWNAKTFAQLAMLAGPTEYIDSVGSRMIAGSGDKTAWVWETKNFTELAKLKGHADGVTSVAVSPDGTRIITGSGSPFGGGDTSVRVWDAKTFAELAVLRGHTGTVTRVVVSPDGARIVTSSRDGTVRLWDAKNFTEMAILTTNQGLLFDVAVSPDGAHVIATQVTADHHTIRVWHLFPTGQGLVTRAKSIASRCLTSEQREHYHLALAPPSWCRAEQVWPYDFISIVDAALHAVEQHAVAPRHREVLATIEATIGRDTNVRARIARFNVRFNWIAFAQFLDTQLRGYAVESLNDDLPLANIAVALASERPNALRDAIDTRGQILFVLGRTDEAFADLNKAITLGLDTAGTFYTRGRVYELKGSRDAAINDYRKSLSHSSSDRAYTDYIHLQARERLTALGAAPTSELLQQ